MYIDGHLSAVRNWKIYFSEEKSMHKNKSNLKMKTFAALVLSLTMFWF